MSDPLRVGCIGAGYFAQFHYEAWRRIDGVVPVASVDASLERARETGLAAYESAQTMLDEVKPDIVDIITPPDTHRDMIIRALKAEPKAIICQKPFCVDLDEARKVAGLSQQTGVPIVIHENFRFQPWYRAMQEVIRSGKLGQVLQFTFRLRPGDGQGPDAYLDRQPYFQDMKRFLIHETAVHWIDTFRFLFGDPQSVFADLRQLNPAIAGEDAGHVFFRYENGLRAVFDGNRLLDHAAENTRCTMGEGLLEGTKASVFLSGDGSLVLRRFGEMEGEVILPRSEYEGFGGDCVYALQNHVAQALRGVGELENTASQYLAIIEQEEAIYASAAKGRVIDL